MLVKWVRHSNVARLNSIVARFSPVGSYRTRPKEQDPLPDRTTF